MLDQNTGIIIQEPTATDFVVGADNQLPFVHRNVDWKKHRPSIEKQYFKFFDSMACVSFSALNVVEAQLNWMLATGQLNHIKHLLQDYITDGLFNFSDRYTAKRSGTTKRGNSMVKVADSLRHHGVVPEKSWQFGEEFRWDEYYKEIPEDIKEQGKYFLRFFDISYEWVPATAQVIKHHLNHVPLQIATSTCPGWNAEGIIQACEKPVSHAYMLDGYTDTTWEVYDHYQPYHKRLAPDFVIPWALKIVVNLKVPAGENLPVDRYYDLEFDGFNEQSESKEWFEYMMKALKDDAYIKKVLGRNPTQRELIAMSYGGWTPHELGESFMQNWHNDTRAEFRAKILHAKMYGKKDI